jgi:hypothetical protein
VERVRFLPLEEEHEPAVPALVAVALGAVQPLMKVANEVNDEFQCLHAILARLRLVGQRLRLSLQCVDDIVAIAAVACSIEAGGVVRDVHVVPRCRFAPLPPNLVRPIRDFGIGDVRAVEQILHGRLRRRREMILSDKCHDLVTFAAPSVAERRDGENEEHRGSNTHPANSTALPTPPPGCREN